MNLTRFLVTTAVEESWDNSRPLLFLGEWCRRHSRKAWWEPLGGDVLDSPYREPGQVVRAYDTTNQLYVSMLPHLAQVMNRLHGRSQTLRYWQIILGMWFRTYVSAMYDRYLHLCRALDLDSTLTTIGLAPDSHITPASILELSELLKDDHYNLQLYTRLLMAMGKQFPVISLRQPGIRSPSQPSGGGQRSLRLRAQGLMDRVWGRSRQVILKKPYLPVDAQISLILRSGGRVWSHVTPSPSVPAVSVNKEMRAAIGPLPHDGSEFGRILAGLVPYDLPTAFVEAFASIEQLVTEAYPGQPTAIVSANSWWYDDVFKVWAARCSERGTLLYGIQHGGNYGSLARHTGEDFETAIVDRYASWGWTRTDCAAEVRPMPAAKLTGRVQLTGSGKREGILFVSTAESRYLVHYPSVPFGFSNYLAWQMRFADALPQDLRRHVRVRFHAEDLGWDIAQRWTDSAPDIRHEGWDRPFWDSLADCRLYVCDHHGTTFLEALGADKPTILYWDPTMVEIRPEAREFYDRLKAVGVLHCSPESAVDALSTAYNDVERWWREPKRQAAVRSFRDRFVRTAPDALQTWVAELGGLAQKDETKKVPC